MQSKTTPFLYLGFISAFSLLTFDLYQPALPAITRYFNTSYALAQLTLSLFFLVFGLSQLFWGPLIDHYGRRKILNIGLTVFLLATVACIFATSIEMLIAARVVQGIFVCCAHVVAFSSSRDIENGTERARRLSHIAMIVAVSPIFAPMIGSVIFVYFGWQATFILIAFIGLIITLLAQYLLYESPHWKKSEAPFFKNSLSNYKEIIRHKQLWISVSILTSAYSCVMIVIVNAAYLIINNMHFSPFSFSVLFGLNGAMIIVGNFIGLKLRERKSLIWNIRTGSRMMLAGSLLAWILMYIQDLTLLSLAPILLVSLGVSITGPPTLSLALAAYASNAGTATAILNTARMTISSMIGGLVGTVIVYHHSMLAIGLFICSIICCFFTFFIQENVQSKF